jgi:hypothetical protein
MKSDAQHSKCSNPIVGELLVPYGLGTLSPDDAIRFEDHVMECGFCRGELEAGFETFAKIFDVREELLQQMRSTGEDFDTQLARLRESREPKRKRIPVAELLKRYWAAGLKPWVYGPVAAVAVVVLVLQFVTHSPVSKKAVQLPPSMVQVGPSQSSRTNPTAETPEPAPVPMAAEEQAPIVHQEAMKLSAKSLGQTDGQRELLATPSEESTNIPSQSDLKMMTKLSPSAHSVATDSAVARAAQTPEPSEVMSDQFLMARAVPRVVRDSATVTKIQGMVTDLLRNPPQYNDSNRTSDLAAMMQRQPGFKVSPSVQPSEESTGMRYGAAPQTTEIQHGENFHKGMDAYGKRDYAAAEDELLKAVKSVPGDHEAWLYLGVSRLQRGEWGAAVQALTRADRKTRGQDALTRYYLALAWIKTGDFEQGLHIVNSMAGRTDSLGVHAAELKKLIDQSSAPR